MGTFYSYEVCNPEEELVAPTAMSFTNAGPQTAKLMAFQQLSKVTQQLIRRKTWKERNEQLIVKVITQMFKRLGLRVTQRKLGQAVPVVGIVIRRRSECLLPPERQPGRRVCLPDEVPRREARPRPSTLAPLPKIEEAAVAAGNFIDIEEIVDAELVEEPGTNEGEHEQRD